MKRACNHHIIWYFFISFIISIIAAIILLFLCACFPSNKVNQRVKQSAIILAEQGDYPALSDMSDASVLDNFTDAIMLMECMSTKISNISSILTNPKYLYADTAVGSLLQYTENETEEPTSYYARYWMGFRIVLRPALTFLSYQEILLYNAILFFSLFSLVIVSIANRAGSCAAITFAISIVLVRPHIICNSLQFSNCFFIAFIAMLLVPKIADNRAIWHLFFWELGIVTMFFDFYTTPLITFAFPAIYLWLLSKKNEDSLESRVILSTFVSWLAGYFLMWIAKLILTDVFTSVSGIKSGLWAMGNWTIRPVKGKTITLIQTLYRIGAAIVADSEGACIWGIAVLLVLFMLLKTKKDRQVCSQNIKANKSILLFAGLPALWFLITYKPTAVHYYFQYRNVAVAYWAVCLLLFFSMNERETSTTARKKASSLRSVRSMQPPV